MTDGDKRIPGRPRDRRILLAVLAVAALPFFAGYAVVEHLSTRSAVAEAKVAAAMTAAPFGSSLGNAVNKRLALVRGMTAFVAFASNDPATLSASFPTFAAALRTGVSGVRTIGIGPDFVVRMVSPLDGNEEVLGLDLLADARPGFADALMRSIESRDVSIYGPLPLRQEGIGLIARQAVFVDDRPWGAIGVIFDLDPMLEEAQLAALAPTYLYALRRDDGAFVAGDPAAFVLDPVIEPIHIADGRWELAVAPAAGWDHLARRPTEQVLVALAFLVMGGLVQTVIVLVAGRRAALTRLVAERTEELAARNRELALAKSELEQFAYIATHDLQEPVRTVGNYVQLLERHLEGRLDDEGRELIGYVVSSAVHLRALVRDMQLYVAEGRTPLPDHPVPAERAVAIALKGLADKVEATKAVIGHGPLPAVMADERRLARVFHILIDNAVTYGKPGRPPSVRITAARDGDFDVLSVADDGIGIAPEHHERVFQVFRRLQARDTHPGTGMGLAIARKMALRLGGDLTVDSRPGQGSVFSLRLPAPPAG